MSKPFIVKLSIGAVIILLVIAYGFYEKYRKEQLYNVVISLCKDIQVGKSKIIDFL